MLPQQLDLPFFTYGLFRPGQIGFRDLRAFVSGCDPHWYTAALFCCGAACHFSSQ